MSSWEKNRNKNKWIKWHEKRKDKSFARFSMFCANFIKYKINRETFLKLKFFSNFFSGSIKHCKASLYLQSN